MNRALMLTRLIVLCGMLWPIAHGCAQDHTVIFTVVVPPSTPNGAKIFISGNRSALGDWNPSNVMLGRVNDSMWSIQLMFEAGSDLEYKITRGGWNSQAIYEDGTIPANSRLVVRTDTEIVVHPQTWSDVASKLIGGIVGSVKYHRGLQAKGLKYPRDLIVWLPPSYDKDPDRRFPVLYMHDGQNIMDPATSFIGYDWKVDEVADSLIRTGKMEEIIVVGIYNTPDRMEEYSDTDRGRAYVEFLVHDVKPFIDSTYRTKPDRANTAVMGSSLGGLISFLIIWWYPDVFSKAGCLSSVFSYDNNKLLNQVEHGQVRIRNVKIYMDCGGYAGEAALKPGMDRMVRLLKQTGYTENRDFVCFYDPTAEHNERAWSVRIWRPLLFFFGRQ